MSQKEYQAISDFINKTLSKVKREELAKQIKKHSTNVESNKMKTENTNKFDPDKAWNTFHKKIENDKLSVQKTHRIISLRNIAASIVLLIGTTILGYFVVTNFYNSQFTEISSTNSIKEVILPDGSQISLNHNSTIKFSKEFSDNNRIVEFSGEAFFEIAKNPEKPFIINTSIAEITVLGTSFNVFTDITNNIIVNVKTGKVKLAKNKVDNIILTPNEEGKIVNNKLEKSTNSDKNYLAWKTKYFTYDAEELSKVIEDFNKVYHVNIILEEEEIGNFILTALIENKELDVALDIICAVFKLNHKTENNTIIISK